MEFGFCFYVDGSADLSIKNGLEGATKAMTALAHQLCLGKVFQYEGEADRQLSLFFSGYGTNSPPGLILGVMERQEKIVFEIRQEQTNVVLRGYSKTKELLFLELLFSNGTGLLYKYTIHQ